MQYAHCRGGKNAFTIDYGGQHSRAPEDMLDAAREPHLCMPHSEHGIYGCDGCDTLLKVGAHLSRMIPQHKSFSTAGKALLAHVKQHVYEQISTGFHDK